MMGSEVSPTTSGDTSSTTCLGSYTRSLHYLFLLHPCRGLHSAPHSLSPVFLLYISSLLTINYFFLLREFRVGHHCGKGPPKASLGQEGSPGWEQGQPVLEGVVLSTRSEFIRPALVSVPSASL